MSAKKAGKNSIAASATDLKRRYRSMKITKNTMGRINSRRFLACNSNSYSPDQL